MELVEQNFRPGAKPYCSVHHSHTFNWSTPRGVEDIIGLFGIGTLNLRDFYTPAFSYNWFNPVTLFAGDLHCCIGVK